ncbi:uncharacterized protein LOC132698939 [Cylas formicarius]|uniref:uncharacterized protein LOC132698939 n=1 Tax=Cylas formicarius TaxID=197179 RepID=UPI002958774C|nr:uncharacterized protein LOC132698939 [Cylas formicarius]XP_060521261.1 uncharacterized protein LOC132698939 [Cylas formicarius]
MQTPVLSKKQQKQSLSGKKGRHRDTIKNVLASPFAKYWPQISAEDCDVLRDVLEKNLARIVPEKPKIPWSELRKMAKEERKLLKRAKLGETTTENAREGIMVGVNDATRALEDGSARAVLISDDVRPKVMVEHLVDQAVLQSVPVLVVPGLRDILRCKCGIGSAAVAFTACERYEMTQKCIEDIFRGYPVPRNHINYRRSINYVIREKSMAAMGGMEDSTPQEEAPVVLSPKVYLFRRDKNERVFTPDSDSVNVVTRVGSVDYVRLQSFSDSVEAVHIPLKVKRIKGNVNRNKRKGDLIKQSRSKRKRQSE